MKKIIISILLMTTIFSTKVTADESRVVETYDFNNTGGFYISDGWSNGGGFDCIWRKNNVAFKDGIMSLKIDNDIVQGSNYKYSGSEVFSSKKYQYGYFAVRMKSIKNSGVVSSFFTYANPEADEIDIEFLGNNSKVVEFNYFKNGVKGNHYTHQLDYDASEEFHEYSFLWEPNSITWFVDGEEIYKATERIPDTASSLLMNVWPGKNLTGWIGNYDGKTPLTAEYDWFRYTNKLLKEDVNKDVLVNINDLSLVASKYNENSDSSIYKIECDIDENNVIDLYDIVIVAKTIN